MGLHLTKTESTLDTRSRCYIGGCLPGATKRLRLSPSRAGDVSLSEREIHLIREQWPLIAASAQDHGVEVFMTIVELRPDLKNLFPFRNVPTDQLPSNTLFRSHSMRFMQAIELTVQHLDALEVAALPSLVTLGKTHASISGFQPSDLVVFEEAMSRVWQRLLGRKYDKDAWGKLFRFITSRITEGFELQRQRVSSLT